MMGADKRISRRQLLGGGMRGTCVLGLGVLGGILGKRSRAGDTVWQIDPYTCIACGNCATHCVLGESAVKCVHAFAMCGYCELCTGFFEPEPNALNEGAENQLCPVGALERKFVEDPYFQYDVDEEKCVGCSRCVQGCTQFGNGSLYLQVRHDLCQNCNACNIAAYCPSDAFVRVPADRPYIPRLGASG